MKTVWTLGLSLALAAMACPAAYAFQEQQGGGAPTAGTPEAAPAPDAAQPKVDLDTQAAAKISEGTEVRIPGLGKLGVLPKMDFGLELLYGAAEQNQSETPAQQLEDDELKLRGTLKHKF